MTNALKSFVLLFLLHSISWSTTQFEHFPTTFDGDSLRSLKSDFGAWNERKIAVSGRILAIKNAYLDKPYFEIILTEQNSDSLKLWIGSLIKADVKVGSEVRLLGIVGPTNGDSIAKKYNKDAYHVLAFCIVNIEKKGAYYLPAAQNECYDWQNGRIPITLNSKVRGSFQTLAKYVGKYPCGKNGKIGLLKDSTVIAELKRLLSNDFQDYQDFLGGAGCGKIEMIDSTIVSDNSQLHVGGYSSIILFDIQHQESYLFWLNGTVSDKMVKIFGCKPIPNKIANIIESKMNEAWGHVGKFKVINDTVSIELVEKNR